MKQQRIYTDCKSHFIIVMLLLSCTFAFSQGNKELSNEVKSDSLKAKYVHIAYGKQQQNQLTAAVSTIYSDALSGQVVPAIGDALVGQLPGLTVRKSSGLTGSIPSIAIRGQGTFNSNAPLLIVDGFKADFNQLSLYEVESISILKDAAATVLYGMDAANGVLLVTTKRGIAGKMKIDVNYNYGIQQAILLPKLLNAAEYAGYYNQARLNDGLPLKYDPINDIPFYGKEGNYQYTHPDNNYINDFLRPSAPIMMGGLNISGGNDKSKYMVSMGYLANEGLFNYTDENKYSTQLKMDKVNIRTNLDVEVMKGLNASVDVAVIFDNRNYPGNGVDNIMNTLMQLPPQAFPIFNPNGSLGGNATYKNNPYGMIAKSGYQTSLQRNLDVNLRLDYSFDKYLKGLTIGAAGASSTWMTLWDNKTRAFATYSIDNPSSPESTSYTQHGDSTNLMWGTDVVTYKRMTFETKAAYERNFGLHSLNGLIMFHADRYAQHLRTSNPYNFDNAGLGMRINYGYNETYVVEFAASYYGQEQYMTGNRFRFFPTGSVAWVASNEKFIENVSVIDYLKFRASYGIVGGGSGLLFPGYNVKTRLMYEQYYQKVGGVNFGETNSYAPASASYQLGFLANPSISCDLSHKFNIGFESNILKHLNINFDYYFDKRTDILAINNLMPSTMGFAGRLSYANGGQVNNSGYELSFDYFGSLDKFSYKINGGIWYNKSKIVKKPDVIPLPGIDKRSGIGMPVGQIFGYEAIGFYASDDEAENAVVKQTFGNTQAGDVIYKDNTGDGKIDISDMVPLGYSYLPQYTYSLSFEVNYKGWYLAALGQGTLNSSVMMGGYAVPFSTQGNAYKTIVENSWSPGNSVKPLYPRLSASVVSNNIQSSSLWLRSGDYFKLRNLEIGYDLPGNVLNDVHFKSARIYLKGLDLFSYAKDLKHTDPETLSFYPSLRSINIGVGLTF